MPQHIYGPALGEPGRHHRPSMGRAAARNMQRTTQIPLNIVIAGGSVAGLSCAYSLRKGGHRVTVIEKREKNAEIPGCLRSPPNMTRLIKKWPGVQALLDNKGTKLSSMVFKLGHNAEQVGGMKFHEDIMRQLDADFYIIQYVDLWNHLQHICEQAGVVFQFDTTVFSIDTSRTDDVVIRTSSSDYSADIAIAADGRHSAFRELVADAKLDVIAEYSSVGVTVPTAKMRRDPELISLCNEPKAVVWMSNASFLLGGLSQEKNVYNMEFLFTPPGPSRVDKDWCDNYPVESLSGYNFKDYEPRVQKMLKLSDGCHPTTHKVYPALDSLVDKTKRVLLIGDAGHATLIRGSHNASMAVEDAVTLGSLLSRLTHLSQLPVIFSAFSEIRTQRTIASQQSELGSLDIVTLPPGPRRERRDAALRATLDLAFSNEWTEQEEAALAQVWSSYLEMFNFDAIDSVDEWTHQYGRLVVDAAGYFVLQH